MNNLYEVSAQLQGGAPSSALEACTKAFRLNMAEETPLKGHFVHKRVSSESEVELEELLRLL